MKPFVPLSLRALLRSVHQQIVFRRAIRSFRKNYRNLESFPLLMDDLIYGWGNMGWSSYQDYSEAIVACTKNTQGPVLECGTGLSTILMAIIASDSGIEIHSLEHNAIWAEHVRKKLKSLGLNSVRVHQVELRSYGEFEWYNISSVRLPKSFALVICDGPPHDTRGGRIGLFPVLASHFAIGSVILLDDYSGEEEKLIVETWKRAYPITVVQKGTRDSYAHIVCISR